MAGARSDAEVELIADLLSLPSAAAGLNLSPQRRPQKLFEALLNQLEAFARNCSMLLVFEDAHWIDPTSRELLDLVVARVRDLPALLIVSFRPEFQPPWIGQLRVSLLALNRLDRHDRTALVEQIAGGKTLPREIIDQIVERTDGIPLSVEELTKDCERR